MLRGTFRNHYTIKTTFPATMQVNVYIVEGSEEELQQYKQHAMHYDRELNGDILYRTYASKRGLDTYPPIKIHITDCKGWPSGKRVWYEELR